MEDKKLVKVGFAMKSRSGDFQGTGFHSSQSFTFPVTKTELEFLKRFSKAVGYHANNPGNTIINLQEMGEA